MRSALAGTLFTAAAVAFALPSTGVAAEDARPVKEESKTTQSDAAPTAAAMQFDRLKSLAGTWTGKAGFGEATDPATVTYRLTGGGTAVMETLFGDTPHEMVTVYHMNGPELMLTHYCATGTQPRMKSVAAPDAGTLKFEFLDGTNVAPEKDAHMHAGWLTFVDADHIRSGWTMYEGGKASGEARFELARQK